MAKQYVQHISGQGEKWAVTDDGRNCNSDMTHDTWVVWQSSSGTFYLPKSEYRLCSPPEVWRDVTEGCDITVDTGDVQYLRHNNETRFVTSWSGMGYRLRKVQLPSSENVNIKQWAFIVEKKVEE